ncbi:hypothetical protein [Microbacterium sp. XT11]|uniref:hypothetical protein n=1 Tax=Microbacterium sp. XT11 TaxID=367477 RepID=UPI00083083A4|nr:hypothetical protein [Microbacterium sp. XT11]
MSEPHFPPAQPSGTPGQGTPGYPQPSGAPGQDAPGYPQPSGTSPYGSPAPAPQPGNPLGRVAFLIAVIAFALGALVNLITPFLFASGNYDVADSLSTVVNILVLLGEVAALVLGLIALRRPEPRLLAAIAVGIAGAGVVIRLLGWASTLLWYVF